MLTLIPLKSLFKAKDKKRIVEVIENLFMAKKMPMMKNPTVLIFS